MAARDCCDLLLDQQPALVRRQKALLRRAHAAYGLEDCHGALRDLRELMGTELEKEALRLEREAGEVLWPCLSAGARAAKEA